MRFVVLTLALIAAAPVEPAGNPNGTLELARPAVASTSRATSPGRSITVTVGQAISSGVLTGPGFEATLGARLRKEASGQGIFASGFEAGESAR